MAGHATSTKQRMVDSAVELLATRGTAGTTIDAVLSASGAPRGSVYHHFPGGRDELVHSAVRAAGARMSGFIDGAVDAASPEEVLAEFASFWRRRLIASDYQRGCPIVALTVGGVDRGAGGEVVREVFGTWREKYRELLVTRGVAPARAATLATLTVAALEGAVLLCRADRSVEALDDVVAELSALLVLSERARGREPA